MIAMNGVPIWVVVALCVVTYVLTAMVYRRKAPCGSGCKERITIAEWKLTGYSDYYGLHEAYGYDHNLYRHTYFVDRLQRLNNRNQELTSEIARLIKKNNRVIRRNRKLKKAFCACPMLDSIEVE